MTIRIVLLIVVAGLVILAFTYLLEFFVPLIIAAILLVIAYFIYRFVTTGTLSF
ncbi:MAG TPA: hypothetical protein VG935_00845 [Patescibacteria group bacterium]|nr:hypothetical protein [Patescibacteria group bacterium]